MDLKGATAMVTGAATRIGRQIAQGLADGGANVAITYRSSHDEALNTLEDLRTREVDAHDPIPYLRTQLGDPNRLCQVIRTHKVHADSITKP